VAKEAKAALAGTQFTLERPGPVVSIPTHTLPWIDDARRVVRPTTFAHLDVP
jgi:hypothetical protein